MKKVRAKLYKYLYPAARLYWFLWRPKTTGVRCIIKNQNHVLLIKHTYGPSLYTVPGGGVERRETPRQAAIREAYEETGIRVTELKPLKTTEYRHEYKRDTVHLFVAETTEKTISIDEAEIAEANWFLLDQLPTDTHPSLRANIIECFATR